MELRSILKKRKHVSVTKSSIWKYKNAFDCLRLDRKLQDNLASDILCLYETSLLADLKLVSLEGNVFSHQAILSSRSPVCWSLISQIQNIHSLQAVRNTGNLSSINLPQVNLRYLKAFVKSLYTDRIDKVSEQYIKKYLSSQIQSLNRNVFKNKTLYLEKLHTEEEQELQKDLLSKLRSGEISKERGNLKDVGTLLPVSTLADRAKHHNDSLPSRRKRLRSVDHNISRHIDSHSLAFNTSTFHFIPLEDNPSPEMNNDLKIGQPVDNAVNVIETDINNISPKPRSSLEKTVANTPIAVNEVSSDDGVCGAKPKRKRERSCKRQARSPDVFCKTNSPLPVSINEKENKREDRSFRRMSSHNDDAEMTSDSDVADGHETSSLEVEFPSSNEETIFSPESIKSGSNSFSSNNDNNNSNDKENDRPESIKKKVHKPLVRTRTFDLIEPSTSLSLSLDEETSNKILNNCNINKSLISESTCRENSLNFRELEKKKGSLLFENSFQTYSNIPTTNMMVSEASNTVYINTNVGLTHNSFPNDVRVENRFNKYNSIESSESHPADSAYDNLSDVLTCGNSRIPLHLDLRDMHSESTGKRSKSPSPDSLSTDLQPSTLKYGMKISNKENLFEEEKEKDDSEISNKASINTSQISANDNITEQANLLSDINATDYESTVFLPKHEDVDKPIASWASQINEGNKVERVKTHRQLSSGSTKVIDEISFVCGYVSPNSKANKSECINENDEHQQQSQSLFSMFIDINDIPSPNKDAHPPAKSKTQASGGMYMFIEADSVPSPKPKRRSKPGLESKAKKKFSVSCIADATTVEYSTKTCVQETKHSTIKEKDNSKTDETNKKGFFMFIETNDLSKENSPKPLKRPPELRKTSKKPSKGVMSKSAPGNCHLFAKEKDEVLKASTGETPSKLMTKSVIDRDEFMAQPTTRRNVSLNDRIYESSKIPRPVNNFKELLTTIESSPMMELTNALAAKNHSFSHKLCKSNTVSKVNQGPLLEDYSSTNSSLTGKSNSLHIDANDTSEFSDVSSLLSSMERTNCVDGDNDAQSSLGNDLLKLFENEINTDVTIMVGERKMKGHKCILASRCVYFAAVLSGRWVERNGDVIKVSGFSPEAVEVALKHIYSGSSVVPDGVKAEELAALADVWVLDGLKEVVALHFKANKCHYFHKPCSECLSGVLEVLPISCSYSLDELYYESLRWISKHFATVFPTRNFASMSPDLKDRCLKQILDDMSVSNVIDSTLGCEQILSTLTVARWTQPVFELTAQLLEAATSFMAVNLGAVFASSRFLELGRDGDWCVDNIEENFRAAIESMRPDQAVLSHIQLTNIVETAREDDTIDLSEGFLRMSENLLRQIEKFLIHNVNRVSVCRKWPMLPQETQKRIKDAALVVVEFSKPLGPQPKMSSSSSSTTKVRSRGSSIEPELRPRTSSLSDHRLSRSASSSVVPGSKSLAIHNAKRLQNSERGHTPPPSAHRSSLQTPPPTRTSTLRAQARQYAIQRSQSAKTVADRSLVPRTKPVYEGMGTGDSSASSHSRSSSSQRPRTWSQSSLTIQSSTSRSSTPCGIPESNKHKRNASGPQLWNFTVARSHDETGSTHDISSASKNSLQTRSMDGSSHLRLSRTQIGVNPLRENLPRDTQGHCRSQVPPSMGQKIRSPLKENYNIGLSPSRVPVKIALSHVSSGKSSDNNKPVPGLGNRSNTFCKDDKKTVSGASITNK